MDNRLLIQVCTKLPALSLMLVLVACGSESSAPVTTTPPTVTTTQTPGTDEPTPVPQPEPTTPPTAGDNTFPFIGTIVLDDYDWFGSNSYLGVSSITLSPLSKKRLLNGSNPRVHSSGNTVYRQPCGERVHRIMLADQSLRSTQLTPCSSEIPNAGFSPTNFGFSTLSSDSSKVAVEAIYFLDGSLRIGTAVFNTSDQSLIIIQDNLSAPMWLRDGGLLLASGEGFYELDSTLNTLTRLQDGLTGPVNNPALHPTEQTIAFEYNQQIWLMSTDGSQAREAVFASSRLRYPAWSPDGTTLAYLAVDSTDRFHKAIYFTDLQNQLSYALDLTPVQDPINVSNVVNGPLSWSR